MLNSSQKSSQNKSSQKIPPKKFRQKSPPKKSSRKIPKDFQDYFKKIPKNFKKNDYKHRTWRSKSFSSLLFQNFPVCPLFLPFLKVVVYIHNTKNSLHGLEYADFDVLIIWSTPFWIRLIHILNQIIFSALTFLKFINERAYLLLWHGIRYAL